MRKILFATIAYIASVVSAAKNSVMAFASSPSISIINDNTLGTATFDYNIDFGYGFNTAISYPDDSNVQLGATFGLYSQVDLILKANIFGLGLYNLKVTLTPLALTPFNGNFQFTHPLAMATQGSQMDASVDLGYAITLGDISTYYYLNNLYPKVSILDWFIKSSTQYLPDLPASSYTGNAAGVNGWDWNIDENQAWVQDPYFKFNVGDLIAENVDGINTSGSYINLDFFSEAEEYM